MTESELIYYRGNCHCSAVVYELRLPKISTVDQCNCSICLKKGYLLVHAGAEAEFKILKGEDALTEYRFHAKRVSHQFCSTCGTPLFRFGAASGTPLGKNLALNVHALQGIDTWKLETNQIDGASLGEEYRPPAHKGSLPAATFSGSTTFTGSCHCGALTVAVTSKPLENNPDVRLVECNCSICERNGYIWVYPPTEHVDFYEQGKQIERYSFGNRTLAKTFCKTCGVGMTNECLPLSNERLAQLPERAGKAHAYHSKHLPVNVRTLHAVDPSKLLIEQFDGKNIISGDYINP